MRKSVIIWVVLLFAAVVFLPPQAYAQAPDKMSYQAVIRNAENHLVTNQTVGMQVSILRGSANGTALYVETHTPTTNANGLVSIEIGAGTIASGDFTTLDWSAGPYFIKTETDLEGGTHYTITGVSQLLSVPYALYAKTAETVTRGSYVPIYTTEEIVNLSPSKGDAIYNSTEALYQIYDGNSWLYIDEEFFCWPEPTISNAGANQFFADGTTSTILSANIPEPGHGTGEWSILSGEGGSFDDINSPNAVFTGIINETYYLSWTISTACEISEDDVTIGFYSEPYKPGEQITDIDGNTYNTVWIGDKNWIAENMKTTRYNDGTTIPLVTNNTSWYNLTTPGYCWYNNDSSTYAQTYGALYNWHTVNTGKLCPEGWHVPTDEEWILLSNYLGGEDVAGGKLKETGTTHWESPNTGATNESGFSGLPGGYRLSDGFFICVGGTGSWWSATEYSSDRAWYRTLDYDYSYVARLATYKDYGFSVRCVRDD
jgi:uncharacterized protein (TIGR02145 family)